MGVPGHDSRDFDFAKDHNLNVIKVIGKFCKYNFQMNRDIN